MYTHTHTHTQFITLQILSICQILEKVQAKNLKATHFVHTFLQGISFDKQRKDRANISRI